MRNLVTVVMVALGVTVVYLAYQTAQESPEVERLAREVACGSGSGCVVEAARPARFETNAFRHEYDWKTSLGPAIVECRREWIWLGPWSCIVDHGRVGSAGTEVGAYPDALERGSPG